MQYMQREQVGNKTDLYLVGVTSEISLPSTVLAFCSFLKFFTKGIHSALHQFMFLAFNRES